MDFTSNRDKEIYEDYIHSEIILYCLKKSLSKHEISPEIKLKMLFILSNDCCLKMKGDTTFNDTSQGELLNPLGVDDDLFVKPPNSFTYEEIDNLRDHILKELKIFHSFCCSMRSHIELPHSKGSSELFDMLVDNLKNQAAALDLNEELQKEIKEIKLEACALVKERAIDTVARAKEVLNNERKLFEEIIEEIEKGKRLQALETVENILEQKIKKNKEKIDKLKFELSEYCNA